MKTDLNLPAADAAIILLSDFRERRKGFHVFDEYDMAMKSFRENMQARVAILPEPLKTTASRLFSCADKGFFLMQVCELKIEYLAEALIHSIEAKNPLSLANNTRALVEHLAAMSAILKELKKLELALRGQGNEGVLNRALQRTEDFLHRAYYGKSPKATIEKREQAIHVNDYAGNIHARRLLVEAAWNNRHRAAAELILNRRRQGQPPAVVAIALKAQHRLYKKFWRLDQRKHRHVAITAVARELCGFIWAILNALN